ncbi:hypothetical protein AZOA_17190 [Azoarcus sp. Aa7]|nr:hypothetical protein [Azoarcus sp. Aa7]
MTIPERRITAATTLADGRSATGEALRTEGWVDFTTVEAEKKVGELRPDIIATIGTAVLFVEIAVTHFVDSEKARTLESMGFPTLEVDLAAVDREKWTWEDLFETVIESVQQKRWVHVMDAELLHAEAEHAAQLAALALPTAIQAFPSKCQPPRTRFVISGRFVDLIERPFGVSIWSTYDPEVNAVIKTLMRIVGGRWQPKFKSWLAPTESKDFLHAELAKLSGAPPAQIGPRH